MKTLLSTEKNENVKSNLMITFHFEDKELLNESIKTLDTILKGKIANIQKIGDFSGKDKDFAIFYSDSLVKSERIALCGLGEKKKFELEKLRKAAGKSIKQAKKIKAAKVVFNLSDLDKYAEYLSMEKTKVFSAIVEGALLSQYQFDKYIKNNEDKFELKEIDFNIDEKKHDDLKHVLIETKIICDAVNITRDLVNSPGNEITPVTFSNKAKDYSHEYGFKITILKKKEIEAKKMGGLLAVGKGSDIPPRFLILEYNLDKTDLETIVLVGKGITFDSGGISLKPANNMWEMRMDMAGAATVLGTIIAASKLRIPLRLIGLIPLAENMPGGSAQKPGDIITISNGKTVEVDNTDAEGRLILADALVYAGKYKPNAVIDLATLTGAVVVALGHLACGLFGTDEKINSKIFEASKKTNERVWELPLFEEYDELIKSDFADVKNVGGRWAGSITAAMFLKKFIGEFPWVHLDIAGTAMYEKETEYIPKGGTGFGVRLLIETLRNWK